VQDTPLRDYATIAGQAYGIDPMIVRGWYDEASQIGDFREQRDLESLDNYGMPYGEYEQALTDMQQQGEQAQEQYTADEEAAYRAEIEAFTGLPADDLLNGAKVGLADLYNTLASPDYQAYASEIMASENDPDTINEILDNVRAIDPMLYRVMTAQYGYLADAGDGG
jgi:hypothetical protein